MDVHRKIILSLCLGAMVLLAGCGGGTARRQAPLPAIQDPGLQNQLETWIAEVGVPGAVLAIRYPDGRKYIVAAGVSEITRQKDIHRPDNPAGPDETATWPNMAYGTGIVGDPMEPQLQFRIASLTKIFVAVSVMQLKEDGKLTLDDTVAQYLGNIVPGAKEITIRQLLGHQSGLPNYTDHPDFFNNLNDDPARYRSPAELLKYVGDLQPAPPGKEYRYSNANYLLLGMIMEKVTGRSYDKIIRDQILTPLNLVHTYIPNNTHLIHDYSHGYRHDFKKNGRWVDYSQFVNPSWLGPAGAMTSNADDLLTFMEYLLDGKLISPADLEAMSAFQKTGDPNRQAGLGLDRYKNAVGMSGDYVYGYEAAMYRFWKIDFVVLTNGLPTKLGVMNGAEWIFEKAVMSILRFPLG